MVQTDNITTLKSPPDVDSCFMTREKKKPFKIGGKEKILAAEAAGPFRESNAGPPRYD